MDSDSFFDEQDELQWAQMRKLGASEEEISRAKKAKQWKEEVYLYSQIIKQRAWEKDISCDFADSYLCLSFALEGLTRRLDAIKTLQDAHNLRPTEPKISLALAKLLFKADQKAASLSMCKEIFKMYKKQTRNKLGLADDEEEGSEKTDDEPEDAPAVICLSYNPPNEDEKSMVIEDADSCSFAAPVPTAPDISEEDIIDAYYLGGWVKIHDDDHSNAYRIWQEGHSVVPSSTLLAAQASKRECWDKVWLDTSMEEVWNVLAAPCRSIDGIVC
jgi:tetratricopeptide (TPR) repeat protein